MILGEIIASLQRKTRSLVELYGIWLHKMVKSTGIVVVTELVLVVSGRSSRWVQVLCKTNNRRKKTEI
jgi:hypothetical protein